MRVCILAIEPPDHVRIRVCNGSGGEGMIDRQELRFIPAELVAMVGGGIGCEWVTDDPDSTH
jgi:hypothetical protein